MLQCFYTLCFVTRDFSQLIYGQADGYKCRKMERDNIISIWCANFFSFFSMLCLNPISIVTMLYLQYTSTCRFVPICIGQYDWEAYNSCARVCFFWANVRWVIKPSINGDILLLTGFVKKRNKNLDAENWFLIRTYAFVWSFSYQEAFGHSRTIYLALQNKQTITNEPTNKAYTSALKLKPREGAGYDRWVAFALFLLLFLWFYTANYYSK